MRNPIAHQSAQIPVILWQLWHLVQKIVPVFCDLPMTSLGKLEDNPQQNGHVKTCHWPSVFVFWALNPRFPTLAQFHMVTWWSAKCWLLRRRATPAFEALSLRQPRVKCTGNGRDMKRHTTRLSDRQQLCFGKWTWEAVVAARLETMPPAEASSQVPEVVLEGKHLYKPILYNKDEWMNEWMIHNVNDLPVRSWSSPARYLEACPASRDENESATAESLERLFYTFFCHSEIRDHFLEHLCELPPRVKSSRLTGN